MPMIREAIVTTIDAEGKTHIAPFGLTEEGNLDHRAFPALEEPRQSHRRSLRRRQLHR